METKEAGFIHNQTGSVADSRYAKEQCPINEIFITIRLLDFSSFLLSKPIADHSTIRATNFSSSLQRKVSPTFSEYVCVHTATASLTENCSKVANGRIISQRMSGDDP